MVASTAAAPYLDVIDGVVARPSAPFALSALVASVDALTWSGPPTVDALAEQPVAYRSREAMSLVGGRLTRAYDALATHLDAAPDGADADRYAPLFLKGFIARGAHEMALFVGDEGAADTWAKRRGCAREATLYGPLDANPLRSLAAPPTLGAGALPASLPGLLPFAAKVEPVKVLADACRIDLGATGPLPGSRLVVVDVLSERAQTAGFAVTSGSAALLRVGERNVLTRGFEAGGGDVTRLAAVALSPGKTRVVLHVAQRSDSNDVELDVWGEDGASLPLSAPMVGEAAPGVPTGARVVELDRGAVASADPDEIAAISAGLLALGEARRAEHLLESLPQSSVPAAVPSLALGLLMARATVLADDLPDTKQLARVRGLLTSLLERAPGAWEATLLQALAEEQRRGPGDGPAAALTLLGVSAPAGSAPFIDPPEIGALRASSDPYKAESPAPGPGQLDPMIMAYVALLADREGLRDVSREAYRELVERAPGSPLAAWVDRVVVERLGDDGVRAACAGGLDRSALDCFDALEDKGDRDGALRELTRVRRLRGADAYRDVELSSLLRAGKIDEAKALYNALPPGKRALLTVPAALAARDPQSAEAAALLQRDRALAIDSPSSLSNVAWLLASRADVAKDLEKKGEELVTLDRKEPFLPGAAVAVLQRDERYDLDPTGVLHFVIYDLRRVTGTTDVEQGAQSWGPMIEGRDRSRVLRRRIHKRDGRVIEPEAAAHAAQAHADLSQLEQGDYVEQIMEGFALPSEMGQLVVDTPDLLPDRTSVRKATVTVSVPRALPLAFWSHKLLGRAEERVDGENLVRTFTVENAAPRRFEDGAPRYEQGVGVSFGTLAWSDIAKSLDENYRSLDDGGDPYITAWTKAAVGDEKRPAEQVNRIVVAAGKSLRVSSGGGLSDVAAQFGGGEQRETARGMIELGQGSRSWVIFRALRELGISAEIAVAETEPWTSDAAFPPHVGRFRYPLVRARIDNADVWIDADVDGPPLPAGRISPELRGREALLRDGSRVVVEAAAGETGDRVDFKLVLDEHGDAKGTVDVVLHGRTAQSLALALETVVGSDRQEMLRGVVLGWLPWADVEEVTLSSEEGSWQVELNAKIRISGYARPEGRAGKTLVLPGLEPVHWVFPGKVSSTLAAIYASRATRESALTIDAPLQYELRRRVELPATAIIERSPAPVKVKGDNLVASRSGRYEGAVVEEQFSLSLPTGAVPAARYAAFLGDVRTIDDGFMAGTRLRIGGSAPKGKP